MCTRICSQLEQVATPAQDLRMHQMAHLLAILMGPDRATQLSRAVLNMAEEGLEVSWYEAKLRKRYS